MKTYKDFEKQYIGSSDIAGLIFAGYKDGEGFVTIPLHLESELKDGEFLKQMSMSALLIVLEKQNSIL